MIRKAIDILSTLLVIVAASVVLYGRFYPPTSGAKPSVEDVTETLSASTLANTLGTGPIAIVEFTDFQCPFCARHAQVIPELRKTLVDTGKVRYSIVNLPLGMHARAEAAAIAAECSGEQNHYWEMHDLLFQNQKTLDTLDFTTLATTLALDIPTFSSCLDTPRVKGKIKADLAVAERLQTRGTPTFFIGLVRPDGGVNLRRRVNGAVTVDTFAAEVAKLTNHN